MTEALELSLSPAELAASLCEELGFAHLDSVDRDGWSMIAFSPCEEISASRLDHRLVPEVRCGGPTRTDGPPFQSGWIGCITYEAAPAFDRHLTTRAPAHDLPLAWWGRYDASLAYHHASRRWSLSAAPTAAGGRAAEAVRARLAGLRPRGPRASFAAEGEETSDLSRSGHDGRVRTILDWIGRGHIYQANLTYRVSRRLTGSPHDLYRALRTNNPAPFGAYLRLPGSLSILSSSPELFLRVRGREVITRPIKGTRPRYPSDPTRDRAQADELLRSEKDRAELTMIVDLERNDLGRVADSVSVDPFPTLESFASVHHLVATVRARMGVGRSWNELLAATFPGGSVTGAPKIRAMEILAELECSPRFVYSGALGWIDDAGDGELALAIRTLWCTRGEARFGVGGGIVADSVPEAEWRETEDKARAIRAALLDDRVPNADHSYRSASIGSSREAFRAGQ